MYIKKCTDWTVRVAAVVLLCAPFAAQAATSTDVQAQIAVLMQQVQALQEQLRQLQAASSGGGAIVPVTQAGCPTVSRSLSLGMVDKSGDISSLQTFLAAQGYYGGTITGRYDAATEDAVRQFQSAEGIVSAGTAKTTGYGSVGPRTISALKIACARSSNGALNAQPHKGAAPLNVIFGSTIAVSATSSVYKIVFGDGTEQVLVSN